MSRCSVASVTADSALDLIEWIYLKHPGQALKMLRERVVFESEPSDFDKALIKVAAKRWEISISPHGGKTPEGTELANAEELAAVRSTYLQESSESFQNYIGTQFLGLETAGGWVRKNAAAIPQTDKRYELDRAVVAAAFDQDFRLLSAARNTNSQVRTRHAEMNLLAGLRGNRVRFDADASIGTGYDNEPAFLIFSLQSCRMCAAAVKEFLEEGNQSSVKVYYLRKEPTLAHVRTGLFGVESLLDF
jgi:tRNA(Arg) A34 adenosine deaminase TadA